MNPSRSFFAGICLLAFSLTWSSPAAQTCDLYPIALSAQTIGNAVVGSTLPDVFNGTQSGNFGWLTWAGSPSVPTLIQSLTSPGDSSTYVNPENSLDHQVSVGDWVRGKPGVSNAKNVRDALDVLKQIDITVPVWDQTRGQGANAEYRVAGYARIRLLSYQLAGQNRITARYLGAGTCGVQNQAPVVNAGADQTNTLPATVTINGTVTDDGLPSGGSLSVLWSLVSGPANVSFSNPANTNTTVTFTAAGTYVFRLTANDSALSASDEMTVTVNRENHPPIAFSQSVTNLEDTTANITLSGFDEDGDDLEFIVVTLPSHGTLAGTPPNLQYTAFADYNGSDSFTFKVRDGSLESGVATVTITNLPVNDRPVADSQDISTMEDTSVTITFSGADVDGDSLTFSVIQQPTNGTLVVTATNATYFPADNYHGNDTFTYVANDGITNSAEAVVAITVTSVNDIPLVDAGSDQLISLPVNSVSLNGVVSDDEFEGAFLVVQWSKVAGPGTVTFSDGGTNANTLATFETNGVYTLRLTADDGFLYDFDELVITVNAPSFVNAGGNQLVKLPAEAVLDGVASDDGLPANQLTVAWSATGPGTVIFSNPTGTNTTASFSVSGLYTLQLIADDSAARSTSSVVVLANRAPTVDAGSTQNIATLAATLTGSVNDDGFPSNVLNLAWSKVSGPGDVTFATNTPDTEVNFSASGTYVLRLTADDLAAQASSDVTIRINLAPVVFAGADFTTTVGLTTNLFGDVEDDGFPAGAPLTIQWEFVSGPGTIIIPDRNSPESSVRFTAAGTYVLRLTASDSELSASDEVTIVVERPNEGPMVSAGPPQLVTLPDTALLRGVALDDGLPNGTLTVQWTKASGPGDVSFGTPAHTNTTVAFTVPGTYVLRLTATDSELTSAANVTLLVRTEAMNTAPVVSAGADAVVGLTNEMTLKGHVTDDGLPRNSTVTSLWTQVSGPGVATFENPQSLTSRVQFDILGTYVLRLFAGDSALGASDDVEITVYPWNQPPVVDAGTDQHIIVPDPAFLTGSGRTPTNASTDLALTLFTASYWNTNVGVPGLTSGLFNGGTLHNSLAMDGTNLYAVGYFNFAGGKLVRFVARWDGHEWFPLYDPRPINPNDPNSPPIGLVARSSSEGNNSVTVWRHEVYIRGNLQDLDRNGHTDSAARWTGTGWEFWSIPNTNSTISGAGCLASSPTAVYVGAEDVRFTATNIADGLPIPSTGILKWNGTNWLAFGSGIAGRVVAITETPNGDVYAAGRFILPTASGMASNIARWDGTKWNRVGNGVTRSDGFVPDRYVSALYSDEMGNVYAGGVFDRAGTVAAKNIAKWNGTEWKSLGTGLQNGLNGGVNAIVTYGRDMYVAGGFSLAGTVPAATVARWNGEFWSSLGSGNSNGIFGATYSLAAAENGIYASGGFIYAGGQPVNNIAFWEFPPRPEQDIWLFGEVTDDGLPAGGHLSTTWTKVSGPGNVTFAHPTNALTTVRFNQLGTYVLRLAGNDSELSSSNDVTITLDGNQPPVVNAGPDQAIGLTQSALLEGVVSDDGAPEGVPLAYQWIQIYGPSSIWTGDGKATFSNDSGTNTVVTFNQSGTYVLRFIAGDSQFNSYDDVTINVLGPNSPPYLYAYYDYNWWDPTIYLPSDASIHGFAVDYDQLPSNILRYAWSTLSGPGPVRFGDANAADTTAHFIVPGTYVLRFTANDSELSSHADVQIVVADASLPNQNPFIFAGLDQTVTLPAAAPLNAVIIDDHPESLGFYWSWYRAPAAVQFDNPNSTNTFAHFMTPGVYEITANATEGWSTYSDTLLIRVLPEPGVNQPPRVFAGPDRSVLTTNLPLRLQGEVTDDGLPAPANLHSEWSVLSASGTVTFNDSNSPVADVTFSKAGFYELLLTVTDGALTSYSWLSIAVVDPERANEPPTVSAGPDQTIILPHAASLTGMATDDDYPGFGLRYFWSVVTGPGSVTFDNNRAAVTVARFTVPGDYVLNFNAYDTLLENSDNITIHVLPPTNAAPIVNAGPPRTILLPTNTFALNGTVTDDGVPGPLTISWSVIYAPDQVVFSDSSSATTTVTFVNAELYPLQGYQLRLTASDGEYTTFSDISIVLGDPNTGNTPPVADAGPDQIVPLTPLLRMQGSLSDDMLPYFFGYSYWQQVSGPAPVQFYPSFQYYPYDDPNSYAFLQSTGVYVFRLFVSDFELFSADDVTITVTPPVNARPVVNPGPNVTVALQDMPLTLQGSVSDDGNPSGSTVSSTWTMAYSYTGGNVTFADANSPTTQATFDHAGRYILQLTASDTEFSTIADLYVTVIDKTDVNLPPIVSAGTNVIATAGQPITLYGNTTDDGKVDTLDIYWSVEEGPGDVNFDPYYAPQTSATFALSGIYRVRLAAYDGVFEDSDEIIVTVGSPGNQPPIAHAGFPQRISVSDTAVLIGSAFDDGLPGNILTSLWSVVDGPGTVTFADASQLLTSASFAAPGDYTLRLTVSDGEIPASAEVIISVVGGDNNQAPIVSAGSDRLAAVAAIFPLNGTVTDDGNPSGGSLTASWSQVSGPSQVYFGNANVTQTVARIYLAGTYVLALTANDGQLSGYDQVTVTVIAPTNEPPFAVAGPNLIVVRPHAAELNGAVFDDDLPTGYPLSAIWTKESGPGAVTFTPDIHSPEAHATFSAPGTYILRLTADDSQFTDYDEITVTVINGTNEPPVISVASNLVANLGTPLVLESTVTDDGLPNGTIEVTWSKVNGPGGVGFSTLNGVYRAAFTAAGNYILRIIANDSELRTTNNVTVTVVDVPNAPSVAILSPIDSAVLTAPTVVTGIVQSAVLQSWLLQYRLKPADSLAFSEAGWIPLGGGTTEVNNSGLATFDPTLLLNGIYELQLTATDTVGRTSNTEPVTVVVDRNMKVGHFTLSFNDLTIPAAGIPIQVIRNYDSRNKQQGDFGVGWSLQLKDIRLQKNRHLGRAWDQHSTGGLFPIYFIDTLKPRIVTITFPDNKVYKFTATPSPASQFGVPLIYPRMAYVPLENTRGTLTPIWFNSQNGERLVDDQLVFAGSVPGRADFVSWELLLDPPPGPADNILYNPDLFEFTTLEGYRYLISETNGLRSITDPNTNTLVITTNGLTWTNPAGSSSLSVVFERDALGRITNILDALGHAMSYHYDTNGNLITFTDRMGNTNGFTYDGKHQLLEMADGAGIRTLANSYSSEGRLEQTADAAGNPVRFGHDLTARREYVTNRIGAVTTTEYDLHGNLLKLIDPVGLEIAYEYDANDNLIRMTNGVGLRSGRSFRYDQFDNLIEEINELGNTNRYTYNSSRKVLTYTDGEGNTTSNAWDPNGRLLETTDPLGRKTAFTYTESGMPATMTDPFTNTVRFAYNEFGFLTNEVDALGVGTSFSADANGQLLSMTRPRTVTTTKAAKAGRSRQKDVNGPPIEILYTTNVTVRYQYDLNGRLQTTIYPDSSFIQQFYNARGQTITVKDRGGRQITTLYSLSHQPLDITYPGNVHETFTYDQEGRVLTHFDRSQSFTKFTYDAKSRLTKIEFDDGTVVEGVRDKLGQVTRETDRCGNTWQYDYDSAGNRTKVTDPLSRTTTYKYNTKSACTEINAPGGRMTKFHYNVINQNWKIEYPDQRSKWADYQGPLTVVHDENNDTTEYHYDRKGRLIETVDPLRRHTSYRYDEFGNVLQKNLPGEVTFTYAYDDMRNRKEVGLPDGGFEEAHYDNLGRLESSRDAAGKDTTYTYEPNLDWLLQITHPDTRTTKFTYLPNGRRQTVRDRENGLTTYSYDQYGFVRQVDYPDQTSEKYEHTSCGYLTKRTERSGKTWNYAINALGWIEGVTDPSSASTSYGYDAAGDLISLTDAESRTFGYAYDGRSRLTQINYPDQTRIRFTRDGAGRVIEQVDQANAVTKFIYNGVGQLKEVQRPLNNITRYQYDDRGFVSQMTDPDNHTTFYSHDNLGRVTQIRHPDTGRETMVYEGRGLLVSYTDQRNNPTTYTYDDVGRLETITDAKQGQTRFTYDGLGRVIQMQDAKSRTTSYEYEWPSNLKKITYPEQSTKTFTYDSMDRRLSAKDENGHITTFTYDSLGRLTSITDPLQHPTTFLYDNVGRLLSKTDANQRTTGFGYDPMGRVKNVSYPDSTSASYNYDPVGRLVEYTDPASVLTKYGYDELGRMVSVTEHDPVARVTQFTYNGIGLVTSQTTADGRTTSYVYDDVGRRIRRILPGGVAQEEINHDHAGNITLRTDFNGNTCLYVHDELNRMTHRFETGGGETTEYGYDAMGFVTSVANSWGVISQRYDDRDRLIEKATPYGTLSYTYDGVGNVRSVRSSNPNGVSLNYGYDDANRLVSATDPHLGAASFSRDPVGNILFQTLPNGVQTGFTYDPMDRPTEATALDPQGGFLSDFKAVYELSGRRSSSSGSLNLGGVLSTLNHSYDYDGVYRLAQETLSGERIPSGGNLAYNYDSAGNRLARTSTLSPIPSSTYGYDQNHRLLDDAYDANGNTRASYQPDPFDGTIRVVNDDYTRSDRLSQRTTTLNSQPATISLAYDGNGSRVRKTVGGVTTHYLVDDLSPSGWPQVVEELTETAGQSPAVTRVYGWGQKLISQQQISGGAWQSRFFQQDLHGSTRHLTDSSGALTDTYDYDAFGNLIARSGTTANNHLYAGEYYDSELDLYYLRARYYQPRTGRFWTADPFEGIPSQPGSLHKYAYAGNDPANFVDPSGNFSLSEFKMAEKIGWGIMGLVGIGLFKGAYAHLFGISGQGDEIKGISKAQANYIQQLSPHSGVEYGRENFFRVQQGTPFLLQNNSYIFIPESGDRYRVAGFDGDSRIFGARLQSPLLEMGRFATRGSTADEQMSATGVFLTGVGHDLARAPGVVANFLVTPFIRAGEGMTDFAAYTGYTLATDDVDVHASFQPVSTRWRNAEAEARALGGAGALQRKLVFEAVYNVVDVPLAGRLHAAEGIIRGYAGIGTALGDGTEESRHRAQDAFWGAGTILTFAKMAERAQELNELGALERATMTEAAQTALNVPPKWSAPANRVSAEPPPSPVVETLAGNLKLPGQSAGVRPPTLDTIPEGLRIMRRPVEPPPSSPATQVRVGAVLKYRDYLAAREKGSTLRGHHVPQSKRLEEVGIDPLEGTVVVLEHSPAHTATRTYGTKGRNTAAAERGRRLSESEALDLADPPVSNLGLEVLERIKAMNRQNHPEHFK